ncbi:hypothetical protein [Aeromonas dhakensis]|uniref:hypothetical protein n=1 Tax=Aeromonas dhakensis TaxID=196024 RepID=UPI001F6037A6|nr:hypothetical protein [Aeromonas dhakensis]UNU89131.1 hypothetical protein GB930_13295 [Aeromonas dhakensis]
MAKISGFGWAVLGVIALAGSGLAYLTMPTKSQVHISLRGTNDGIHRTEAVKQGFGHLAQLCPAITKAKSVTVTYEQSEFLMWRNEQLGWQSDYYFQAVDHRGETHHIYLRDDGKNELIIHGKQSSLDWCGIKQKMEGYYLIAF